jgi:hypothetical protein
MAPRRPVRNRRTIVMTLQDEKASHRASDEKASFRDTILAKAHQFCDSVKIPPAISGNTDHLQVQAKDAVRATIDEIVSQRTDEAE